MVVHSGKFVSLGVALTAIDSLARRAEKWWPLGDWEQRMLDENETPSVSVTVPAGGATFTAPASFVITLDALSVNGAIEQVSFYADGEQLSVRSVGPHEFAWTNVTAGTYTLTAEATDGTGAVGTSAPITITVEEGGSPSASASHTVEPHAGWNLTSSHVVPDATAIETVFDGIALTIVGDDADHVYRPQEGLNTIGHWRKDGTSYPTCRPTRSR